MRVGFNISPLKTGHSYRGIGSYTQNLKSALEAQDKPFELEFIEQDTDLSKFDLIHYPFFDIFFHTLPIHKKTKRVVTIHDVIPLVFPNHFPSGVRGNIALFQQRWALKNVDWIICDSKTSKVDIADKFNYPNSKITPIYLAASELIREPLNKKQAAQVSTKFSLPEKFALYVGDVNWNKNINGLLSAISIAKVPLVMVGKALKDDSIPQTQEANKLIKDLKIENKVIKTGYVDEQELKTIYKLATVCVLPSYYEGFGLPAMESITAGTPLVCSNNSSLSEITTDDTAFYCNPEEPEDIAANISQAFALTKSEREKLSDKLQSYSNKFTWEKVAKETIGLYQNLLK